MTRTGPTLRREAGIARARALTLRWHACARNECCACVSLAAWNSLAAWRGRRATRARAHASSVVGGACWRNSLARPVARGAHALAARAGASECCARATGCARRVGAVRGLAAARAVARLARRVLARLHRADSCGWRLAASATCGSQHALCARAAAVLGGGGGRDSSSQRARVACRRCERLLTNAATDSALVVRRCARHIARVVF